MVNIESVDFIFWLGISSTENNAPDMHIGTGQINDLFHLTKTESPPFDCKLSQCILRGPINIRKERKDKK
jgi:hypothetical protein